MNNSGPLVYCALGGAGEIGMNCYLYGLGREAERRWIMVDLGLGFGDMETAPGVELVLPDIEFAVEERSRIEALFITHAHEDHIGAIIHQWRKLRVPIHARKFTAEVIRRKLREEGYDPMVVEVAEANHPVEAGPFAVEFLPTTHSIPESSMLMIRTAAGNALHTGDFKIDPEPLMGPAFDLRALERLGDEGVLALLCDSTNVFVEGHGNSESDLVGPLTALVGAQPGAVAATTFASNVTRLRTLAQAAVAADRSVVIAGRAMRRMIEIAVETGQLTDFPRVIGENEAASIPREHLFFLVTGSQGEHRAAIARIAAGTHPTIEMREGDTVLFSSKNIPGNEGAIYRLHNRLSEQGVRVIDSDQALIHVSGHARAADMEAVYRAVRPTVAVPVHGEHRHLVEHARRALEWGAGASVVAPNGSVVELDGDPLRIVEHVETGRIFLDGIAQVGAYDGVIRDRLKMARQGHVIAAVTLDDGGELLADPEIRCIGAPKDGEGWQAPLDEMIAEAVDEALEDSPRKTLRSDSGVEELVSRAARRICSRYWGKKPVMTVIITRLEE